MPWPMRFGPPPRIMTLRRSVGRGLALLLVGRVQVGGLPRTRRRRCRRACRPGGRRARGAVARTASRRVPSSYPRRRSEKPCAWRRALVVRRRSSRRQRASATPSRLSISSICSRNQGSIAGQLVDLLDRHADAERSRHVPDALGAPAGPRRSQISRGRWSLVQAVDADLQPAQRLLERLLEGAARSPSPRPPTSSAWSGGRRPAELLEREARDLGDHVVDASARTRRCRAAGDVVAQLVQRVADRQLGGDLGDREAGGLGGQRELRDTRGFISITIMRPSAG